jgi:DNA polymerase III sliding clamp (beta) subunit (PCNA family)
MTIGGDFIGFVARNTASGEGECEVEADVDGDEVVISLNGGYLSDALNRLDCDQVVMTYADRATPIKLEGGGREAFIAGQRG